LVRNARLLEEAREASRAKSEFLNMAGHELRTPLAIVRGYLSLIATGVYGETPAEWASVLMLLEDKSRELSVMVESILTAARLQSGRLQTSRERVDLVAIVQRTVERATAAAALSGGAVVGRYPHEPIYVEGDPTQLSVIVDNLLANAVKYSSPPAAVTAAVQYRDGAAEVRIADRGRGIPPEHKDRIFEEFVRIDNLDRDYPPGTGLGLYIARQLAERYGGSLELEWSEPGRGSTFVLRLPALESPVSPA
jgi:signal transduction histidine kinase